MKTCTITAKATLYGEVLAERRWTGVNIMRIGHTTGWCTRQLNKHPQNHVLIQWECLHDQPAEKGSDYRHYFTGSIVRIQGRPLRRGYFE